MLDYSLSVSSPDPEALDLNEGQALTLTCQASSNTIQHTHLSFAWYLQPHGKDTAQTIASLDKDFTLGTGQGFEERYQAGLIRLEKIGEATYKLGVAELQVSDSGKIYCHAHEWIQDPDRSWYSISDQRSDGTDVTVKAKG